MAEQREYKTLGEFIQGKVQREGIFSEIENERSKQDLKWGLQDHHPEKWLLILMEEVGEASEAILEAYPFRIKITDEQHAGCLLQYRDELIQSAAVTVAAIECLDRAIAGCTLPGR